MKDYIVINGQASLHSGKVKLNSSQAKDRAHNLKVIDAKKGLFEIINTINFKKGEEFSYDGPVNKAQLEELGEVVDVKAKKAAKDKAKNAVEKAKDDLAEVTGKLAEVQPRILELETEVTRLITEVETEKEIKVAAQQDVTAAISRAETVEAKIAELEEALKKSEKPTKKDKSEAG